MAVNGTYLCSGLVLVVLCLNATFVLSESYDVCVIGGGASGSYSGAFLKQLGYSVKLIEKNNTLGGHCNTIPFQGPDGNSYWLDIGVQVFTNSTWFNLNGFGNWAMDSVQFVSQFVSPSLIVPLGPASFGQNIAAININLQTGELVNSSALNETAFGLAFETLISVVSQYPWLSTGERPDPIPAFMFEPFSDFIVQHNLQILVDPLMNGVLFAAGVGDLAHMDTLNALTILNAGVLLTFSGTVTGGGFIVEGGCHVVYEGIANYLGSAVTYNATIEAVSRSEAGGSAIFGSRITQSGDVEEFEYECGSTVVSIYPLLANLAGWFDLTETEAALFSNQVAQGYLAMSATFTDGPLLAGKGLSLYNLDPTKPYNLPAMPNLSTLSRTLPFGPSGLWANSESALTPASTLLQLTWQQLANIPEDILVDPQISAWSMHQYNPHWKLSALAQSPTADTRLASLQGTLDTYWVGAGTVSEGTVVVWNQAYKLLSQHFPSKLSH